MLEVLKGVPLGRLTCSLFMAVASGVQGGALAPPSATWSLEEKDKDYNNWMGINKFFRTIVDEIMTNDSMCFFIYSFKNICMIGDFIALHCCIN